MSRILPADFRIDRSNDQWRRRPLRGFLFAVVLIVACLIVMAIGVTGCAHSDQEQLELRQFECMRDSGRWTVEYTREGEPARWACTVDGK
jgi:hypothetical protein